MARKRRSRSSAVTAVVGVVVVLALVGLMVKHAWLLLGIAVFGGSVVLAGAICRDNRQRSNEYSRFCSLIAAEADQQNDWVMQGDDRGVYGPQGIELMRFIASDESTSRMQFREPVSPTHTRSGRGPSSGECPPGVISSTPPRPLSRKRRSLPAVVVGGGATALVLLSPIVTGPDQPSSPPANHPPRSVPVVNPPKERFVPPPSEPSASLLPPPVAVPVVPPARGTPYRSCEEAAADGRVNIPSNDPAYNSNLDRNSNGLACEV